MDGRFVVRALVEDGGVGQVFLAEDLRRGERAALKVLSEDAGSDRARFVHEIRALSELSHPGIVRYVGHGVTEDGRPYLAMEWLEGEDLAHRLRRSGLTIDESVAIAARVAEALGEAHARRIVHRDLKPSNIFLGEGRGERVKVLDFGVARLLDAARLTRRGVIVGTPGYMAPEQAHADFPIDARADIFSLGCVLFECLTRTPAFVGEHWTALLGKVLFAEPPSLRELRPEVPAALEKLVARMLAKDPEARPRDGAAAAKELHALAEGRGAAGEVKPSIALTAAERRFSSILLVMAASPSELHNDGASPGAEPGSLEALREGVAARGGRLERLRDGSLIISMAGVELASDQAGQAARAALWLRSRAGVGRIAISTGRGDRAGGAAAAEAIERAARLLLTRELAPAGADDQPRIAIDELTAGLLDGRFDVREGEGGLALRGERGIAEMAGSSLMKPSPFVGRDRELTNIEMLWTACVREPMAHAALVIGPAGSGKSRLAQEFLADLREMNEPASVWVGRGDALHVGSDLYLLRQVIRSAGSVSGDERPLDRRERIEMGAFIELLRVECAAQPVLLLLEDMHWCDALTARFVDAALRDLDGSPLLVLALARPEVHVRFPSLWSGRRMQTILLSPLSGKASERFAREALDGAIDPQEAARIVARANGNVFYLQELLRGAAGRRGDDLPDTVLAMAQSTLAVFGAEDRRALRAASIFGEVFWPGGVAYLLGASDRRDLVRSRLSALVESEVLVRRPSSRFTGEEELAFRHPLLRDAAYAMLTDADRILGHRLALEWLERGSTLADPPS